MNDKKYHTFTGHKSRKILKAGNSKSSLEDTLKDNTLLGAFDSQNKFRKRS